MPLRSAIALLACLVPLLLAPGPLRSAEPPAAEPARAAGHWEGEIELPNKMGQLQVKVDLAQAPGGAWTGTIDIPAQGAKGLPLEEVSAEGDKVHFRIKGVPGDPTFDGKLEGGAIRGNFTQGGGTLTFRLGREAVKPPARPQEPKPPFPYTSEEVSYTNGDVKLAGTLTLPPGDGPFPAALLITGSGAQDRDEALLGHKPFLVLADHLTRHGIAVLRVDDRGVGGSTGSVSKSTSADFAQDALAGVRFLKGHAKIAKDRIGLIGHSEGGVIAPLAATLSPDVAFVVMLAGTGVPGPDVLLRQVEIIDRAEGAPEASIQKEIASLRQALDAVRSGDPKTLDARLGEVARKQIAAMSEQELKQAGGAVAITAATSQMATPWFVYFVGYDPRPALRKVKVPVLALNGALDRQVDPDQNLPEIEKALKEAGNPDVTIVRVPGVNHLFQPAKTGGPSEYAASEITLAPEVLDTVTNWITARFAAPRK